MSGKESTAQKVKDLDLAWLLDCGDYISNLSWSKRWFSACLWRR
jgi:hypothetical protein